MKKHELHAINTGDVFPPGVKRLVPDNVEEVIKEGKQGGIWDFILPLVMLVVATLYFGNDVLTGSLVALVFTTILYVFRKIAKLHEIIEQFWAGFGTMLQVFGLLVLAFSFKDACANLGFVDYVIEVVEPVMSANVLAAVVFVVTAAMAFAMANFWGLAAIVTPIGVALATAMDANVFMVCAAIFSGAAFGSHACFYADAAILIGKATDIRPYDHAITQLPYCILAAVLSTIGFLIVGSM